MEGETLPSVYMEWKNAVKSRAGKDSKSLWIPDLSKHKTSSSRQSKFSKKTITKTSRLSNIASATTASTTLKGTPKPKSKIMKDILEYTDDEKWSDSGRTSSFESINTLGSTSSLTSLSTSINCDDDNELFTDEEFINFPSYLDTGKETPNEFISGEELEGLIGNFVTAMDDHEVRHLPTRHVDYLSHDWREEDFWASWKHVVSRREEYDNAPRLENACWRSWAKSRINLPTVSPESIRWTKDHDVTWLYGPLQKGKSDILRRVSTVSGFPSPCTTEPPSPGPAKPILKRPSILEKIHRSSSNISVSRLSSPSIERVPSSLRLRLAKTKTFPMPAPATPPRKASPTPEKSVRFHQEVTQCVVVDTIHEEDGESISSRCSSPGFEKRSGGMLHDPLGGYQLKKSIEILPGKISLKGEGNVHTTNKHSSTPASPAPSRISSYLSDQTRLTAAYSYTNKTSQPEVVAPKPHSIQQAGSKILDAYVDSPSIALSDEEYFEMEMFGANAPSTKPRLPHSHHSQASKLLGEEIESINSSSPSISEYLSSGSDEDEFHDATWDKPEGAKLASVEIKPQWEQMEGGAEDESWWDNV